MKTSKVLALALALLLVLGCCSVALADGQYTITYAIYGQAGVYTTQTVTEGDPLGTLPAGPTVAGKVFVRWFRMEGADRVTVDVRCHAAGAGGVAGGIRRGQAFCPGSGRSRLYRAGDGR